jgi:putative ABC transport system permease protein
MARRYWPDASWLGKRVRFPGGRWREIVGVVRDVRHWGLDRPVNPEMYCPLAQLPFSFMTFVLATDGNPAALAGSVREALRQVDPDLPLSSVRTMEQVVAVSTASRHAAMSVLGTFAIVALILAAAGIYGVMSHVVSLRTSEIGVRMTMGARRGDIMCLVLREGVVQASIGLAIGIASAVLLMRSFQSLLYEVSPADPITLVVVAATLLATALLACAVPARRAMNVDPVTALRQ